MSQPLLELEHALRASLVLIGVNLLAVPQGREKFKQMLGADELEEAETTVQSGGPLLVPSQQVQIQLPKDRIRLEATPPRSVIERQYPTPEELPRLITISQMALNLSDWSQCAAWGFNVESVYQLTPPVTAGSFIKEHVFRGTVFADHAISGGSAKLNLQAQDDNPSWQLSIEPRFNDNTAHRLYVGLNLTARGTPHALEPFIQECFVEVWGRAHQIMNYFREGGK